MKNKYVYHSFIFGEKIREILDYFFRFALLTHFTRSLDIETTKISVLGGCTKHRLSKLKGISKENFYLHLKECGFRYNTRESL